MRSNRPRPNAGLSTQHSAVKQRVPRKRQGPPRRFSKLCRRLADGRLRLCQNGAREISRIASWQRSRLRRAFDEHATGHAAKWHSRHGKSNRPRAMATQDKRKILGSTPTATVSHLHEIGAADKKTMRDFDRMCLTDAPKLTAAENPRHPRAGGRQSSLCRARVGVEMGVRR